MSTPPAAEYDEAVEGLDEFGATLCGLVKQLLHYSDVEVHSVTARVKKRDSATKKLASYPEKYTGYEDLTDLLGVRVIAYFPDEVDRIASILTPEFAVDLDNSVDKRASLDPDRFGYLSLHYIAGLEAKRAVLVEYQRFAGMRFELQIRSILQHAWAEIEHDLGYKVEGALPKDMRRRFSRLAGLLELADDEFARLRDDRDRYQASVSNRLQEGKSDSLAIDQSTVLALVTENRLVQDLDLAVAAQFPAVVAEDADERYAGRRATGLTRLHIETVDHLLRVIEGRFEHVRKFAEIWLEACNKTQHEGPVPRGIGLFYLEYTLVAVLPPEVADEFWASRPPYTNRNNLPKRLVETWSTVVAELGQPPAP